MDKWGRRCESDVRLSEWQNRRHISDARTLRQHRSVCLIEISQSKYSEENVNSLGLSQRMAQYRIMFLRRNG